MIHIFIWLKISLTLPLFASPSFLTGKHASAYNKRLMRHTGHLLRQLINVTEYNEDIASLVKWCTA